MKVKMRILHINSGVHLSGGGPPRSVTHLTDNLQRQKGLEVSLFSQRIMDRPIVESKNPEVERRIFVTPNKMSQVIGWRLLRALGRRLAGLDGGVDAVHLHGAWLPVNHFAATMCRRAGIPYFIHPRGMLEPWPLSQRPKTKALALALYQMRDLDRAQIVFATSELERANLQRLGVRSEIVISPNGTPIPSSKNIVAWSGTRRGVNEPKTILFLSRIHEKKGLELLFEALSPLDHGAWRLEIVGSGKSTYLELLRRVGEANGISDNINWRGELDGEDRSVAFASADIFVLPSYSENFGLVVAEALAHATPVITTDQTPWNELDHERCGWTVEASAVSLRGALCQALQMGPEELSNMGHSGYKYVQNYAWDRIASELASQYKQILVDRDVKNV